MRLRCYIESIPKKMTSQWTKSSNEWLKKTCSVKYVQAYKRISTPIVSRTDLRSRVLIGCCTQRVLERDDCY